MPDETISHILDTMPACAIAELEVLGWDRKNRSDITSYLSELVEDGFAPNNTARQILETFGGFTFNLPEGGISWITFTITEARHTFGADYVPLLGELIGEKEPCPVGGGGGYILFACPSGKCALLQEEWFYLLVADSLGDIFPAILFKDRRHCREIPNVEACRPNW